MCRIEASLRAIAAEIVQAQQISLTAALACTSVLRRLLQLQWQPNDETTPPSLPLTLHEESIHLNP